ncbi:hypothetical protein SAMN04490239_9508 [Rhodococcus koreensis]|uniref:DUF3263 domain-containing protein n=1 Tax=Rhodococcus koreensis TaxID=99653 RepID=A0A1H5F5S8_9NOCA|nr:hypothetical protein SAMN04490239_9508 [Rhodococcus koreensis]
MNRSKEPDQSTREDDLLVQFFQRWAPFGGGSDEDIMVTFGVTRRVYVDRLRSLACSPRILRYPIAVRMQIHDFFGVPSRRLTP